MSSTHNEHEAVNLESQNKFMSRLVGIAKIFDGPATFFRGKINFFKEFYLYC